jgi:ABC-type branched-subunit amino acid transport system ATPase component
VCLVRQNVEGELVSLNYGRVVACGTCEEVKAHPDVVKAYLGG